MAEAQLTDLIHLMQGGDARASDSVFTVAAARLRVMARSLMACEKTAGFDASDLVQETYAQKVSGMRMQTRVSNREHFYSLMAAGMKQVLTDRGRARGAQKRQPVPVEELLGSLHGDSRKRDLSLALRKLEGLDLSGRDMIRKKYELGMTWEEIAAGSGRTVWQVRAECEYVLRWLRNELA